MKRYFIAITAAAFVGSAVIGSAAALSVSDGIAQTGTVDAACDSDGVSLVYKFEGDDTDPYTSGANLSGIDPACDGWVSVHVFDAADNVLGKFAVATSGATATGNWNTGDIDVADIDRANVTFTS